MNGSYLTNCLQGAKQAGLAERRRRGRMLSEGRCSPHGDDKGREPVAGSGKHVEVGGHEARHVDVLR